ncbi:MAG: ribonuclease Y [Firmicutes bacterium]|nr:ribonuclease Y [Bacillota bacterium]
MLNIFSVGLLGFVMQPYALVLVIVGGLIVGAGAGILVFKLLVGRKSATAQSKATKILEEAYSESKTILKEAKREAEEEKAKAKSELNAEIKERRDEVQRIEQRIIQREESLDNKEKLLDTKIERIDEAKLGLENKANELEAKKQALAEKHQEVVTELERVSGLTKEDAKNILISEFEEEAKKEAAILVRNIEQEAKDEGHKKANDIIALAIQKYAADQTSEVTVSTVTLPNDDMKGRLIGREGRNIRALEAATGVDLIIDDTPDSIVVSGFDPVRRAIAKISIDKLMQDGRIHPTRIEETVSKVRRDIEIEIKEAGDSAMLDADIHGVHPELVKLIGRLKYRTSYGQNVLKHSLEVAYIAGLMAAELGADVRTAKRGGMLHDIGKAVDHETDGTHTTIGVDLATKFKESAAVVHCIAAHHGDIEYKSIEAILVQAADAISSARPGARRESVENYVKRLQKLEEIANGFKGVEKSFAIQAGREVRIIVKPEDIDDDGALFLAKEIAKKIEAEMEYPGQIKVNVIRESRAVEYAK